MAQEGRARLRGVVVTGASSGIGEACALRLDRLGLDVFATVLPGDTAEPLRARGSDRLRVLELDVTDAASIAAAADTISGTEGEAGLSGLVNNAGVNVGGGPLEFVPLTALRRQFEVNVIGQVAVTQALLPLLRKGNGRIVMIGSVAGGIEYPFLAPYAASKAALRSLTASLRTELRPWRIPVSIVIPGVIATPIWEKAINGVSETVRALPPDAQKLYGRSIVRTLRGRQKLATTGSPADVVANAVEHALLAEKPRRQYVVGRHAGLIEFSRRAPLPGWAVRWLMRRMIRARRTS